MAIVNLPFPGFYESMYSGAVDNVEERDCEYMAEKETDATYYPEDYQPEHLRIDASEYQNIFMGVTSYSSAYRRIAEWYVEAFDRWMVENVGTPAGSFTFESMDWPHEYNFATDRVYANVPDDVMQGLFDRVGRDRLAELISERFTSRDGFSSFYSNDIAEWLEKPLSDWDHNELATLLLAYLPEDDSDWRWEMYESAMGDEGDYHAWSDAVDWSAFESAVADLRAEKAEAWAEENPGESAPIARDTQTLELPL